jgi:ribosome assembly protein YihI (activator of Der GTPase)
VAQGVDPEFRPQYHKKKKKKKNPRRETMRLETQEVLRCLLNRHSIHSALELESYGDFYKSCVISHVFHREVGPSPGSIP